MALPTWSQVWTQIQGDVKLHEDMRSQFVATYIPQENVVTSGTNLLSYNSSAINQAVARQRSQLDGFLQGERATFDPLLAELGRIMGTPETDASSVLLRLTTYMVDNPASISPGPPKIQSRQILRGAFVKGSPFVGSGNAFRLFVDPYGNCLESGFADLIQVRCVGDRQSGSDPGRELFEFRGQPRPDTLTYYQSGFGSGISTRLNAVSADDSAALILNPSFADFSGTVAVPTGITSWEFFTGGVWTTSSSPNCTVDQTNTYRSALLETTPASLAITATQNIRQRFSTRRSVLSTFTPYYLQIAWRADLGSGGAWTGTLTVKLGTNTFSVTVAGQVGWQILQIPIDKNTYFKNWDTDDASLEIDVVKTSGANTWLNLDDVVLAPFRPYDGHWVTIVGGVTPFLFYDTGSFTDTEPSSTTGKIQQHLQRLYGYSLPSAPKAPTGAPVAAVSATAGAITAGTHVFAYTWVDTQGVESAPSPISNAPTFDGTKKADLTSGITVGGSNIATRKIYMSKAGTTTPLYFVTTLSDNVSTSLAAFGVADASLTVVSPSGATIADPA